MATPRKADGLKASAKAGLTDKDRLDAGSEHGADKGAIKVIDFSTSKKSLKKHVAAIHTDGQLSLLQRKLSNVLLLNAYDDLLTKVEHEIDEKTLCVMLGYDSNDRAPLKAGLKALAAVQTQWDILDDEGGEVEWGVASLLSHVVLSKGRCRYGYAPSLAEKLYNPAIYANINMKVQRRFRSGHALALYENCYRFKNTGSTGWWDIQLFRRLLGVGESEYYKSFKHLNAKIIKPITKEINKSSDINIEPEFKKQGRSITEIRFKITLNDQLPLMDIDDDDALKGTPLYERLRGDGISHKLACQWIISFGKKYVSEKLDYADLQKSQGRIRGSVSGFINAAITQDYHTKLSDPVSKDVPSEAAKQAAALKVQSRATEKAREENVRAQKRQRLSNERAAKAWLSGKPKAEQAKILNEFKKTLDKPYLRDDFAAKGLKAAGVSARFAGFYHDYVQNNE